MIRIGSKVVCIDNLGTEVEGMQVILSGEVPKKDSIYVVRLIDINPKSRRLIAYCLEGIVAYNPKSKREMCFPAIYFREVEELPPEAEALTEVQDKELVLTS